MLNNETLSLEEKEWKAFTVKEVFSEIERGHTLNSYSHEQGNLPYISATSRKNGIYNFINNNEDTKIFSNCLTVANNGSVGVSFYHPYDFALSGDTTILKNITFNKFIYLFLSTILNRFSEKYNYATKLNNNRLLKEMLLLPTNKEGQFDYEYMEKYVKNIYKRQEEKRRTYIQKTLETLQYKEIEKLEEKEWKEFSISELFDVKGTKTTSLDVLQISHTTKIQYPYITTKATNNGIEGFFYYKTEKGNVITFDSATVGCLYYQKNDFSASDHVEKLIPKNFNLNLFNAHFIICSFNKAVQKKFNYGFKLSQNRIKKQKLLLPINKEGQPDFEYMEQYVKNLLYKKLQTIKEIY